MPTEDKKFILVAPSMQPSLSSSKMRGPTSYFTNRSMMISIIAVVLGVLGGLIAQILTAVIGLFTNLAFYGTFSFTFSSPKFNNLGLLVIIVPVIGGLIVGMIAKYGSTAIRGHGIPEAMEQVLTNKSKIAPKLTLLKPLSAAIAIGTGGPFGAEGPIIATGGAMGSMLGQFFSMTSQERKILLACGAAAGMTATFGSPLSAILLAMELLLFEFKPASFLPVTLSALSSIGTLLLFKNYEPIFFIEHLKAPTSISLLNYFGLGLILGAASIIITKSVYKIEDWFEKIPIHWMWWPALGGIAVGIIGYFVPATLGVGYENIDSILNLKITGTVLLILFIAKFISWSIALGSGTSGGTLAPLFTIGGGLSASLATFALILFPNLDLDPKMAALAGMAAVFAGSSRAIFTSIVFAFETTLQPSSILPLLACCSASYLVSLLFMKQTIMTEKISRRGVKVPSEYITDYLDQMPVEKFASKDVITINENESLNKVRDWLTENVSEIKHHTFPVITRNNIVKGVVTREQIMNPEEEENTSIKNLITKPLTVLVENNSIREAAELMAESEVYSIPLVNDLDELKLVGILSRNDILKARKLAIIESRSLEKTLSFNYPRLEKFFKFKKEKD